MDPRMRADVHACLIYTPARSRLGPCQGSSSIKNGYPLQRLATPLTSLVYVELNIIPILYSTIYIRLQHRPLESREGVIANRCRNPRFGPLLYQKLSPKNLPPSTRGINFAIFIPRGGRGNFWGDKYARAAGFQEDRRDLDCSAHHAAVGI